MIDIGNDWIHKSHQNILIYFIGYLLRKLNYEK